MDIPIDDQMYHIISNKPVTNKDLQRIKDTLALKEAKKAKKRQTTTKFCVVIKK